VGYGADARRRVAIEKKYLSIIVDRPELSRHISYTGNKSVPLLRLYRYKEAFGFDLVRHFLAAFHASAADYVFDPFAGMGTALFTSMLYGIHSVGIDRLPIACFVARTMPLFFRLRPGELSEEFRTMRARSSRLYLAPVADDVPIMSVAFDEATLKRFRQWKACIDELRQPLRDVFLLLFFAILEETSFTSKDGQFLRLKRDKTPTAPDTALRAKVMEAEQDLEKIRWLASPPELNGMPVPEVLEGDTLDLRHAPFSKPPSVVITSPPYANRYDYTRSYCLELCFHFVSCFEELRALRMAVLRSHIESRTLPGDRPCHPALAEALDNLAGKPLNNPRIPHMLVGYFVDMVKAINEWARVLAPGAHVALAVDNVRFEGELIPVDLILSDLAEEAGFQVNEVLVARYKGNSSQQMKKYGRVPVRESVVVWRKK